MVHLITTFRASRFAIATTVALVCLVACVGAVALLGGSASATAKSEVAKAPSESIRPSDSVRAHAHSGDLGVPGMTEQQLRDFETATLGPEHAAEHAAMRRDTRLSEVAQIDPEPTRNTAIAAAAAAGEPEDVGRWDASATINFNVVAIHAAMLPTGKVMLFSYPKRRLVENSAQAWLWDPATERSPRKDPPLWRDPADGMIKPANIWCAGQTFTADGRAGRVRRQPALPGRHRIDYKGLNKVYTFNPFNETWTEQPDMAPRALVSDRRPAARRAHPDPQRARRDAAPA